MKSENRDEPTDVATPPGPRSGARAALPARLAVGSVAIGAASGAYLWLRPPVTPAGLPDVHLERIILGFLAAALVAVGVAWYLTAHPEPESRSSEPAPEGATLFRDDRARQHARWFVHMRWIAAAVSLLLFLIAVPLAAVLPSSALIPLFAWWVVLVVGNGWFARRVLQVHDFEREILYQVTLDLVVLTGWLHASGGIENPFYQAYVLHVIIAGTLLPPRRALTVTLVACSLVSLLAISEYLRITPHVTIEVFPHDHVAPGLEPAPGEIAHAAFDPVFVLGRLVPFLAILSLVAYLTTMIANRLRRSELDLEDVARAEEFGRRRLEGVIHSAGLGVVVVEPDLTLRWYGGRAAEWLGLTDSSLGTTCAGQGIDDDLACLVPETVRDAKATETERVVKRPGGELRHFHHATWPVIDAHGRVQQVVKLIEDVTARKALEAEAVHAGKLSALGKMAAAVAHEINNPLASLAGRIALMERNEDPQFWRQSLDLLKGQIVRISRIVHTVSQFGRAPSTGRTTWDIQTAVEEALNVIRLDPRAGRVEITWHPTPVPLLVTAVRDQIIQAYLNLLINAVEAMPDGGDLFVRAFVNNGDVAVEIRDSGGGIDEAVEGRLFEPFATTKPSGTGIGLAISQSLVQGHGGRIEVLSQRGTGSCFTLYLPEAHGVASRWASGSGSA
jgi:signal transduction histidine kinase